MKHRTRFLGGIGTVALVYGPLRWLDSKPAAYFILGFIVIGYILGWLLERDELRVGNYQSHLAFLKAHGVDTAIEGHAEERGMWCRMCGGSCDLQNCGMEQP